MSKKVSSKKPSSSNNSDNSKYLIIAAAAILCLVIYRTVTRNRSIDPPSSASNNSVAQTPGSVATQTEILDKSDLTRMKAKTQDKKRIAMAAKEALGMQSMPIPKNGKGQYELPVVVAVKPIWCKAGEYESIKSWVRDFDKKIFLVSLESTTSSGELAKPIRVNLSEIAKGFKYTFKLKMSEKTNENVTLSICTDRQKLGKCSEHKAADYPRLDALQSKKPDTPIKEDFTFVFHNLFIKDGEIWSYGALEYTSEFEKKISSMLKKEGFEMGAFEKNWKTAKTIRSGGVGMGLGKLTASITRNDPNCDLR